MTTIKEPQGFGRPTDEERRRWSEQIIKQARAHTERMIERGYDLAAPDPILVTDLLPRPTTEAQRLQALDRLIQAMPHLASGRYANVITMVHGAATIAAFIANGDLPALRLPAAETDATPAPEDAS